MVDRKVVPFDEFCYQLKLMHLFQKHPVFDFCRSVAYCGRYQTEKERLCKSINDRYLIRLLVIK
jgi:hypothetical protein